jgi:L-alanine-DL-glutamate epimerase-like enolase superfamily enzyme
MITTNDYADATRRAIADGYDCIKVDPVMFDEMGRFMHWNNYGILRNEQLRIAVARIAAIRKAGGPDLDIIIELHGYTDTNTSIQLGRELEQFRCFYYEDPTQPLNPNLFKEISDKVKIPIASG